MKPSEQPIRLKTIEKSLLIAFVLTVAFSFTSFFSFAEQCEDIPNHVLRLHVLANSDTAEDQELKLYVRNRILTESAGMLDDVTAREEAEQVVAQNLPRLEAAAADEIRQRGYDYSVGVGLETIYFPTRRYEQVTLPAGTYNALRVTIGQAEGKNWWCVMFPPMCLPAAQEKEELDDVLNPQQMDIVTGEYEIRFKSLELYEQFRSWVSEKTAQDKDDTVSGSASEDEKVAHSKEKTKGRDRADSKNVRLSKPLQEERAQRSAMK